MKNVKREDPVLKDFQYSDEYYDALLNKNRIILLYNDIDESSAYNTVMKIKMFNYLDEELPIIIEINSNGGSITDGFTILNAIEQSKAPIHTIVSGAVCSMAALINVVGTSRFIYPNSYWMQHSSSDIVGDYINYIKDRTKFLCDLEEKTEKILTRYTKLNKQDFEKIRTGELWLSAENCLKKGVVDFIIK